jgi:hypothetical protein
MPLKEENAKKGSEGVPHMRTAREDGIKDISVANNVWSEQISYGKERLKLQEEITSGHPEKEQDILVVQDHG